ncbi:MAG: octanoyltransferase [Candidatus Muproteobacteria bacterium RBG_16_64_10]|uniref:Octanoyltransferase n=1 Tax=Candidatus Muproteobacteria bacterium RBG_16_64_10 TaxID=1817757 RepID=A0A1F6T1Q5_9PROT|nr:MAG: octanoyltransferase [Candidatus Muproteobacteria bacterium RBG_16_64_10]
MKAFTEARTPDTPDELWLLEHDSVYTLGLKCRARPQPEALHGIPVVQTDRGGDITWHGPGQLVVYTLIDLERLGIGIRTLVNRMEQSVVDLLAENELTGERRTGAPGVYVGGAKVAALGLRIRRGATYHGLALNIDPDLTAFSRIDPCGYAGLAVTSLKQLGVDLPADDIGHRLVRHLSGLLGYTARVSSTATPT